MAGTGIRTDITQEQVLMQQNFQVIFGDPQARVEMIGDIDGTNVNFTLEDYPIYPERKYMITPDTDDMIIELCKGTTYTPATVTAFKTVTDNFGDTVNGGVTLSSAPAIATVDYVYATYVHQFQPVIIQSFEPKVEQKNDEISSLGTDGFIYGFGPIKTSIKSSMIASANSVEMARKLFHKPAEVGSNPVETGFDASTFSKTPKLLYAFMAVTDPQSGELLGFYKFEQCMIKPDILGMKTGKAGEFVIEFTVGAQPVLLTPQIAGSSLAITEITMTPATAVTATPITNLTAVLEESNGNLIAGKTVTFYIDGDIAGTATTNSSGIATLATYTPSPALSAGSYPLVAEYAGDNVYAGSHGHSVIVITAS
jgi:hypothetical protein